MEEKGQSNDQLFDSKDKRRVTVSPEMTFHILASNSKACPVHEYLWGAGGHQERVGPPWVVVVVHRGGHIKGHELQSRYEAWHAAVTVFWHSVGLWNQEAHVTVCYAAVGV